MKSGKRHYSVSRSVKINGSPKRPAVCYALTDDVAAAVEKMAASGQARIYDEEVRFVSGRAVPAHRTPAPVAAPAPAAAVAPVSFVIPAPAAAPGAALSDSEQQIDSGAEASDPVAEPGAEQAESAEAADSGEEPAAEKKSSRRTKQPA